MPRRPAADVPKCHGHVDFLAHQWESKVCRPDLIRSEFAHYLVGEGKGDDGTLPSMFTREDLPPSDAFAKAWLRRDKNTDSAQPGFNDQATAPSKRWPINQAWCADIIRRDLPGEKWHFRLMASPEKHNGERVNMQEFARVLMGRVDEDLNVRTFWSASAHYNTPIPHVHIGVRGIDADGKQVYFHSPYANRGFEYRAREVLKELLSARSKPGKQALRAG